MVKIRIGSRISKLALAYAEKVKNKILEEVPNAEITLVGIQSDGDIHPEADISKIGGKGVFCSLIEQELFWNNIDVAVHSLKDMPGQDTPGLCVHGVLERNDYRDVLLGKIFDGAIIGTSSPRRSAQMLDLYREHRVQIKKIRGNVETRIKKLQSGQYDAIVLAKAGLDSLNIDIDYEELTIIPAVGQGIIAMQTRNDSFELNDIIKKINHEETFKQAQLERALLKGLGGDCDTKVAAIATGSNPVRLEAVYYD